MKKTNKKRSLRKCNNGYNPLPLLMPKLNTDFSSQIPTKLPKMLTATPSKKQSTGIPTDLASNAIGAITDGINTWADPTLAPLNVTMTKGPILYQKTEYVNNADELSRLKKENTGNALKSMGSGAALGASIGTVVPGIGNVIGGAIGAVGGALSGIFGAGKRKRKLKRDIREANEKADRINSFNFADAHTNILQQDYADLYEDTEDDVLYNNGKTPFTSHKKANALVGKGETIIDGRTGLMTEVTNGSGVGIDDVPANIQPEDAIAGNKRNPRTGNTFAQDMKPLTRMENKLKRNIDRNIKSIASNTDKLVRAYSLPMALSILSDLATIHLNSGKTPKYKDGKIGLFLGTVGEYINPIAGEITTMLPSIYNTIQGNLKPDYVLPNQLYAPNNMALSSINRMLKRRYNVLPEIDQLRSLESNQRYNSRQLGSEGGINRALDVAGSINLLRGIANTYGKKQNIDNRYIGEEANMMAQLGAQQSALQTQAMQLAYDINAKNAAMQKQYKASGLQGMSLYAQTLKRDRNRKKMDDMRMRALQLYLLLGTTQGNINYLLGE